MNQEVDEIMKELDCLSKRKEASKVRESPSEPFYIG